MSVNNLNTTTSILPLAVLLVALALARPLICVFAKEVLRLPASTGCGRTRTHWHHWHCISASSSLRLPWQWHSGCHCTASGSLTCQWSLPVSASGIIIRRRNIMFGMCGRFKWVFVYWFFQVQVLPKKLGHSLAGWHWGPGGGGYY